MLPADEVFPPGESHDGIMFELLQTGSYSDADIQTLIAELVDGYDLFEVLCGVA
jgi:hypothetical protein